ncbi:AAA family ATPase [bacterium]|nr:AAA family ATPase [bacterium]
MLKSMLLENFTVFPKADFEFGKHLNVFIGDNSYGKSHVLMAAYSVIAVSAAMRKDGSFFKSMLPLAIAEKFERVFLPDEFGRLVRRRVGQRKCSMQYKFDISARNMSFAFSSHAKSQVKFEKNGYPTEWVGKPPVFLPTRELLTIAPVLPSLYEERELPFEETWPDTCTLLNAPLKKGRRFQEIAKRLEPLEDAMGGKVETDKTGRFYLNLPSGRMEMHLVAEGLRKLATIARLIANGSLLDKGYLFWDEPEANLNPKITKTVARTILQIAHSGIQVFIATHSLFLMRELHILMNGDFKKQKLDARFFGLHFGEDGAVNVQQGKTIDDVGDITALDEELQQSDRYLNAEMGLPAEPVREA